MAGTDVLMVRRPADPWAPGVWTLGGQGNSLAVETARGLLLVDAGPGKDVTARMIEALRRVSDRPVAWIVYSHGHMGYNNGVGDWMRHAESRGEAPPQVIAHARLPARYRRYRETAGLQSWTNTRQFRVPFPADPPAHWYRMPDQTYEGRLTIDGGDRQIVLLHAPSETDDATAVWLPAEKLLYGGCAFIKSCPNPGTPFRIHRDPLRWAETLERFLDLGPRILVPEFGRPLTDPAEIEEALSIPARAMRWVRREVVERMNRGMGEIEILRDLDYPAELFGHRFMKPGYGCGEYIARDVWRSENGWWDRNPTHLHPAHPADAGAAVLSAIADPARVLARAQELADAGAHQLAMHVVDLLALAPGDEPCVAAARALKARLCETRAADMTSAVSRQIYLSMAEELRGQPIGSSDTTDGRQAFGWL